MFMVYRKCNSQVDSVDLVAKILLRTDIVCVASFLFEDIISLIEVHILITIIFAACNDRASAKS